LSHAHRIVARTDAIPILSTVLMVVRDGRVAIKATSAEMVAETSCPAEIEESGEFALPLAPLVELMRKLPAGTPMGFSSASGAGEVAIRYRR
ncbi:hypothetical protein GUH88_00035, partial [Xanthomonas citri pv. citri]|nr:hypothetical protein [Xanthomonas citri pv. citri]